MSDESDVSKKTYINTDDRKEEILSFNNQNSFRKIKLKNFTEAKNGKGISKDNISDNGIPCIRYGELYTKYNEVINSVLSKTNLEKDSLILSEWGDILIPTSGETSIDLATASCILDDDVALSGDLTILKTSENPIYLSYYINAKHREIAKYAQGVSVVHLYYNDFKEIEFFLPSKEEQEKISKFLLLVDKKIELLEKKYKSFMILRNFLLQNLLTQKLRFKNSEGNFFSEWKKIQLKDIGQFFRGHSYTSSNVVESGLLVLRSNNIQNNMLDFSKEKLQFVNRNCKADLNLLKNDIVICMSNGSKKLVGKTAEFDGSYTKNLTVGAFCSIYRSEFSLIKYYFQTNLYKKYLHILLSGTNINNLKNSDLEVLFFKVPTSNEEIIKIFNLLTSTDKKMDLIKTQLENTKKFKKGLLQKMFI